MLTFSPRAWLKLQFLLHAGATEVGAFGLSAEEDLLYVEDVVTVTQRVTVGSVAFDDRAVADHFEACFERGLPPARCGRIWIHTHPGDSAEPSPTDEDTFERVFGTCDWALMFILSRTGRTYARFGLGAESTRPAMELLLPVAVDWSQWPRCVLEHADNLRAALDAWQEEYLTNVHEDRTSWLADRLLVAEAQHGGGAMANGLDELPGEDWLDEARREWWSVEHEGFAPDYTDEALAHAGTGWKAVPA